MENHQLFLDPSENWDPKQTAAWELERQINTENHSLQDAEAHSLGQVSPEALKL